METKEKVLNNYYTLFEQNSVSRLQLANTVSFLADYYDNFLLDVPARTGKSLLSVEILKRWKFEKVLILSGSNATNDQWRENIANYNPDLWDCFDVYCYQSLHKIPRDYYDVIFVDEFDLVTENRFIQLQEFNPKHWIAMSGTLEEEHIDSFRDLTRLKFFNIQITFQQAVDWGILPQPKIYSVALELDDTKSYLVYYTGRDKKKKNIIITYDHYISSYKDYKVNTLVKCTEKQYYILVNNDYEKWKGLEEEWEIYNQYQKDLSQYNELKENNSNSIEPEKPEFSSLFEYLQNKMTQTMCRDKKMRVGNERKKFFADIKNRHFKKLFSQLPQDSRVLVFCNDTAQADLLNEQFSVHSNKPDSIELVEQFNNKKIDKLFSIKMLERGVDFKDVDYLIIIQSSMKQGGQIQKFARSGLSVAPKTILFYYPGTQDEKYVKEFLKQFKPEWIIQKTLS